MGTAPATAAPHLTGSDTSKTIAWSSEKKLSQRNFSLSWCIPLLVLLLAPIPAPGPLMFRGRTELPHETSACRGWGWNGKQAQEHPSGGGAAVGVCPCQLPAEDHFALNLARHPCAGTRLWCQSSCHGISTWTEPRDCIAVLQMPPRCHFSWQPHRFEGLGSCCASLLGRLLAWGR